MMGAPTKSVQFPEPELLATVVCEVPSREDWDESLTKDNFFSKQEYIVNRQSTKRISRDSDRKGHSKRLENAFSEKSQEAQDNLNHWCLHGHERRGLERWACRSHGEQRQQDQFQAVMLVLQTQDEMLCEGQAVDDEQLRKVSHKATRLSRHFARMMGKADMYAVENEALADKESAEDDDAASVQTTTTQVSSVISDDEISLPRVDELKDSKHKPLKRFNRFPKFLNRSLRKNAKKDEAPIQPKQR